MQDKGIVKVSETQMSGVEIIVQSSDESVRQRLVDEFGPAKF